jgi:hypothetical protein
MYTNDGGYGFDVLSRQGSFSAELSDRLFSDMEQKRISGATHIVQPAFFV